MIETFKGYRSILFGLAVALTSFLQEINAIDLTPALLLMGFSAPTAAGIGTIMGVAFIVFRLITNTPVGRRR